ncbi:SulP family inorganic anion transporter [Aeromicrobium tamlense]|uniref:SulP family inorganic anion transporter n=1 Tax=Aeromicrobium tamlense TaxID=375541 RepID=A0A8I0FUE5_9ACTN|nr:SulP family inorganic anion transporter [Aeromicrobium tamlense]MBD1271131.1 SulP family inorganic anion transporter [Aeromicrobium tamlense]
MPADAKAGFVLGVESVPDGLAAGLLAGVNPVFGLYGYLMGTLAGAFATGSFFMTVQVTGAMAVTISDVPLTQSGEQAGPALATLAVLTGVIMLGLGIAGLGSLVRFIPASVLIGFVNAVAVNIVLGQFDNFTGYESEGANRVLRALDTVFHPGRLSLLSIIIGLLTVALILGLERTRIGPLGLVLAIIVASGVAALFPDDVSVLADLTTVPDSLPTPQMPALELVPALILPALSLALIGLVQGAAVSGSVPNPDGRYPDPSTDFRGQGIANIVTGLMRGMPVGGSMSATSLVRSAGARTATANVVAAVTMALAIVLSAQIMGYVAMPALAALLIVVGLRTFKIHDIMLVVRTGPVPATVLVTTFGLTLLLPLQYAVLAGVAIAVVLHVARQSNTVVVRRWTFDDASVMPIEGEPPRTLAPQDEVIVTVYGSLFFAAAPVFLAQLPSVPASCRGTVVILRLRGKDDLGSTFIRAVSAYAGELNRAGGTLMVAGVSRAVTRQLEATGVIAIIGRDHVFEAEDRVGSSLAKAREAADRWRAGSA